MDKNQAPGSRIGDPGSRIRDPGQTDMQHSVFNVLTVLCIDFSCLISKGFFLAGLKVHLVITSRTSGARVTVFFKDYQYFEVSSNLYRYMDTLTVLPY
jgi:hypothetical protein